MNLPSEFQIMGNTIKIKYYKKLANLGEFYPEKGLIKILNNKDISEDQVRVTLCHELSHCLMYNMGMDELYKNEQFVDILGNLIYQFIKTMK